MFNWFKKIECNHEWSKWYLTAQTLRGPYGITENPINERICKLCELRQHQSVD